MNNSKDIYLQQSKSQKLLFQRVLLLCFIFCTPIFSLAQLDSLTSDTSNLSTRVDSSITGDSLRFSIINHKSSLENLIDYQADDSIALNMQEKKAYLYGNAQIIFDDATLKAAYIVIDFESKDVFATGIIADSTTTYVGRPSFDDNGKVYEADTMRYNFESKKGISYGVLTSESDGYIHGEKILRDSLENVYVKGAKFTTCDLPNPHFYIRADKIKVIPKKQIITGPANLVIADISTPLFVPFGFFPIPEKRKKGILFPTFGESDKYGFNMRELGYYLPINQYLDAQITGDIYFRGSWRVALRANYYRKYRYRGNLSFETSKFKEGEPESSSYKIANDYKVGWAYQRDAKAKPGSTFRANVNFVTTSFLKNNTTNYEDLVSTNSTSSISYGRSFLKKKLNTTLVSNMSQNLKTGNLTMTLPQITANLSRQMPFKNFTSKNKTARSFMRNLGVNYSGTFKNEIKTVDTILVAGVSEVFGKKKIIGTPNLADGFKSGISHSIPISTSFKALRWINLSPSFRFNEYWYFKTTDKTWDTGGDSLVVNRNVSGFKRAYSYRTSIGLRTTLYGMKSFKKGKLLAIRHVVTPNISAVWNPDFGKGEKNGYKEYIDSTNVVRSYSIYEDGLLGKPSGGPQGSLNFGMGNNLEIKIRSAKDTTNGGIKKVKIIERLNINSGYNFLADSFHLANFRINANTTILNKIRMTFNSTLDPYEYRLDSAGTRSHRINDYAINSMKKLGHFTSTRLSISTNLNPQAFAKKTTKNANEEELEYINNNINDYVDFNLAWSLNINYNLQAATPVLLESTITQSVGFTGDIKLTENWKIGVKSGYDISKKEIATTAIRFDRDLHCWQMHLQWYPIGRQMFDFGINVKSGTLKDLKLNRRRSWFDF